MTFCVSTGIIKYSLRMTNGFMPTGCNGPSCLTWEWRIVSDCICGSNSYRLQATFAGPCFLGLMGGQVDHLWADICVCLTILYFYRSLRLLLETWLGMCEWSNNWQGGVGNGWHGEELRLELSSCYDRGAVVWWMLLLIHQVDGCILHLLFFINSLWELHDILQ